MAQFRTRLKSLLNVKTKITGVEQIVDRDIVKLIFDVEPDSRDKMRCPHCLKRCGVDDQGSAVSIRLWRHLDAGMLQVWLRYKGSRIICREHGVHREAVPWAVHGSRFTQDFEQQVTWLSLNMSKKAMASFMKIDWATVGHCISRCRERI